MTIIFKIAAKNYLRKGGRGPALKKLYSNNKKWKGDGIFENSQNVTVNRLLDATIMIKELRIGKWQTDRDMVKYPILKMSLITQLKKLWTLNKYQSWSFKVWRISNVTYIEALVLKNDNICPINFVYKCVKTCFIYHCPFS